MTEVNAELTELARATMPFAAVLELAIIFADAESVVARAPYSIDRTTGGGVIHGGALMALADSVGAMCAVGNLPPGTGTSTIESKTNFFRPVTEGDVTMTATRVHAGRTTIVIQTDITRADGKLVSRTTQTQAVLGGS